MGKEEVVLIDTSSWIEALRTNGGKDIRQRVFNLMVEARAAWCDMVAVELWNGARGDYEKQRLSELEREITCLQTTAEVWLKARDLAKKCRRAGQAVPSADILIVSCAISHRAAIEHCDSHMDFILKAHFADKKRD